MKKFTFLFVLGFLALSLNSFSQIKVNSTGNVGIKTTDITNALVVNGTVKIKAQETSNWGSALQTTISNPDACAYHLYNEYYGKTVFFVHGSGYLWCKLGGYFGSDIRMKEDIRELQSPLSKILKLKGVTYKYKNDKEKDKSKLDDRIGLIAQDVEKILPEVVKDMDDGTKAIAYTDIIGVLVEAIKEQQIQINDLKSKTEKLSKK